MNIVTGGHPFHHAVLVAYLMADPCSPFVMLSLTLEHIHCFVNSTHVC